MMTIKVREGTWKMTLFIQLLELIESSTCMNLKRDCSLTGFLAVMIKIKIEGFDVLYSYSHHHDYHLSTNKKGHAKWISVISVSENSILTLLKPKTSKLTTYSSLSVYLMMIEMPDWSK